MKLENAWNQRQGRLGFISIFYVLGEGLERDLGEVLPTWWEGALG